MPRLKSWGQRKVQKLLSKVAFNPTTDPTWSIVGEGVSDDYFLGKSIEHIRLLRDGSEKFRNFNLAVRYLVCWAAKTNLNSE